MRCEQCGTQNQASAQFCVSCGNRLADQTTTAASTIMHSRGEWIGFWIVGGLCVLYLINPTLGVFELIPDNLPIIGNLDEVAASAGLFWALKGLGVRLPGF